MSSEHILEKVSNQINKIVPANAEITAVEFEGPEVAIYSKNPRVLVNDESIVKELAKQLRKRITGNMGYIKKLKTHDYITDRGNSGLKLTVKGSKLLLKWRGSIGY